MTTDGFTDVVTSYRDPTQLQRLLATLRRLSPDARIVVSHDRKSPDLDRRDLAASGAEHLRTPRPVSWGDDTYLESVLAALRYCDPADRGWVTLLSAQDYPLRSTADYEAHLAGCGADALLEFPPASPGESLLRRRYLARSTPVPRWAHRGRYERLVNAIPGLSWHGQPHGLPARIDVRRLRTPFGAQFQLHRGADLFAVNGRAARALLRAPAHLVSYFARTRIPSEAFPHTVLRSDRALRVRDEPLHFTRWAASSHPEWLGVADYAAMTGSGRWFARKFLPSDPVLDLLDRALADPHGRNQS